MQITGNPFTKTKVDTAIRDMNNLITGLIDALRQYQIDEQTTVTAHNSQLILNDVPQDFFLIQYDSKDVIIQMSKPVLRPCFYFIEDDVHIFTDVIQEVICFFKGTKYLN